LRGKGLLDWMEQRKGNVEKLIKMVHKYTMWEVPVARGYSNLSYFFETPSP